MFMFVNPKTNEEEFSFRFETLQEAIEKRSEMGYDYTNLYIKMVYDWKGPKFNSFYYSSLSVEDFFKKK